MPFKDAILVPLQLKSQKVKRKKTNAKAKEAGEKGLQPMIPSTVGIVTLTVVPCCSPLFCSMFWFLETAYSFISFSACAVWLIHY